jgi:predicted HD phosphohydrolase
MQYSHDHASALLHDLDVTGAEYRTAVQDLSRTIADGKDLRASDPAFVSAYEAAHLAQQRYRRALDAYKEHFRENQDAADLTMRDLTLH